MSLSTDLHLISRLFLPCTLRTIRNLYGKHELALWKEYFRGKYEAGWSQVPSVLREEVAERHLNSAFGAMLFECSSGEMHAKAVVRQFIEFLLCEDTANLSRIERINTLSEDMDDKSSLEDEELEYIMKQNGLDFPTLQSPDLWKSLSADLTETEILHLLQAIDSF